MYGSIPEYEYSNETACADPSADGVGEPMPGMAPVDGTWMDAGNSFINESSSITAISYDDAWDMLWVGHYNGRISGYNIEIADAEELYRDQAQYYPRMIPTLSRFCSFGFSSVGRRARKHAMMDTYFASPVVNQILPNVTNICVIGSNQISIHTHGGIEVGTANIPQPSSVDDEERTGQAAGEGKHGRTYFTRGCVIDHHLAVDPSFPAPYRTNPSSIAFVGASNTKAYVYDLNVLSSSASPYQQTPLLTFDMSAPTVKAVFQSAAGRIDSNNNSSSAIGTGASNQSNFIVVACADGRVRLLDSKLRSINVVKSFEAHSGTVQDVSIAADGRTILSCGLHKRAINPYDPNSPFQYSVDPLVKIFDVRMQRLLQSINITASLMNGPSAASSGGTASSVHSVHFIPDLRPVSQQRAVIDPQTQAQHLEAAETVAMPWAGYSLMVSSDDGLLNVYHNEHRHSHLHNLPPPTPLSHSSSSSISSLSPAVVAAAGSALNNRNPYSRADNNFSPYLDTASCSSASAGPARDFYHAAVSDPFNYTSTALSGVPQQLLYAPIMTPDPAALAAGYLERLSATAVSPSGYFIAAGTSAGAIAQYFTTPPFPCSTTLDEYEAYETVSKRAPAVANVVATTTAAGERSQAGKMGVPPDGFSYQRTVAGSSGYGMDKFSTSAGGSGGGGYVDQQEQEEEEVRQLVKLELARRSMKINAASPNVKKFRVKNPSKESPLVSKPLLSLPPDALVLGTAYTLCYPAATALHPDKQDLFAAYAGLASSFCTTPQLLHQKLKLTSARRISADLRSRITQHDFIGIVPNPGFVGNSTLFGSNAKKAYAVVDPRQQQKLLEQQAKQQQMQDARDKKNGLRQTHPSNGSLSSMGGAGDGRGYNIMGGDFLTDGVRGVGSIAAAAAAAAAAGDARAGVHGLQGRDHPYSYPHNTPAAAAAAADGDFSRSAGLTPAEQTIAPPRFHKPLSNSGGGIMIGGAGGGSAGGVGGAVGAAGKQRQFRMQQFNYRICNDTPYVGLENNLPFSFTLPLLQLLFSIDAIRNQALLSQLSPHQHLHTQSSGSSGCGTAIATATAASLWCELGFLFHTMSAVESYLCKESDFRLADAVFEKRLASLCVHLNNIKNSNNSNSNNIENDPPPVGAPQQQEGGLMGCNDIKGENDQPISGVDQRGSPSQTQAQTAKARAEAQQEAGRAEKDFPTHTPPPEAVSGAEAAVEIVRAADEVSKQKRGEEQKERDHMEERGTEGEEAAAKAVISTIDNTVSPAAAATALNAASRKGSAAPFSGNDLRRATTKGVKVAARTMISSSVEKVVRPSNFASTFQTFRLAHDAVALGLFDGLDEEDALSSAVLSALPSSSSSISHFAGTNPVTASANIAASSIGGSDTASSAAAAAASSTLQPKKKKQRVHAQQRIQILLQFMMRQLSQETTMANPRPRFETLTNALRAVISCTAPSVETAEMMIAAADDGGGGGGGEAREVHDESSVSPLLLRGGNGGAFTDGGEGLDFSRPSSTHVLRKHLHPLQKQQQQREEEEKNLDLRKLLPQSVLKIMAPKHTSGDGSTKNDNNDNNNSSSSSSTATVPVDAIDAVFGYSTLSATVFLSSGVIEAGRSPMRSHLCDLVYSSSLSSSTRSTSATRAASAASSWVRPAFAQVLWSSLRKETMMRGWCSASKTYEPCKKVWPVLSLPREMLAIACGDTHKSADGFANTAAAGDAAAGAARGRMVETSGGGEGGETEYDAASVHAKFWLDALVDHHSSSKNVDSSRCNVENGFWLPTEIEIAFCRSLEQDEIFDDSEDDNYISSFNTKSRSSEVFKARKEGEDEDEEKRKEEKERDRFLKMMDVRNSELIISTRCSINPAQPTQQPTQQQQQQQAKAGDTTGGGTAARIGDCSGDDITGGTEAEQRWSVFDGKSDRALYFQAPASRFLFSRSSLDQQKDPSQQQQQQQQKQSKKRWIVHRYSLHGVISEAVTERSSRAIPTQQLAHSASSGWLGSADAGGGSAVAQSPSHKSHLFLHVKKQETILSSLSSCDGDDEGVEEKDARAESEGVWYLFNDFVVQRASEWEALSFPAWRHPCLLFYARSRSPSPSQPHQPRRHKANPASISSAGRNPAPAPAAVPVSPLEGPETAVSGASTALGNTLNVDVDVSGDSNGQKTLEQQRGGSLEGKSHEAEVALRSKLAELSLSPTQANRASADATEKATTETTSEASTEAITASISVARCTEAETLSPSVAPDNAHNLLGDAPSPATATASVANIVDVVERAAVKAEMKRKAAEEELLGRVIPSQLLRVPDSVLTLPSLSSVASIRLSHPPVLHPTPRAVRVRVRPAATAETALNNNHNHNIMQDTTPRSSPPRPSSGQEYVGHPQQMSAGSHGNSPTRPAPPVDGISDIGVDMMGGGVGKGMPAPMWSSPPGTPSRYNCEEIDYLRQEQQSHSISDASSSSLQSSSLPPPPPVSERGKSSCRGANNSNNYSSSSREGYVAQAGDLIAFDGEFVSVALEKTVITPQGQRVVSQASRQVLARISLLDCGMNERTDQSKETPRAITPASLMNSTVAPQYDVDAALGGTDNNNSINNDNKCNNSTQQSGTGAIAQQGLFQSGLRTGEGGEIRVIADDYVLPNEPVLDYVTRFSGITAEDLNPAISKHAVISPRAAYLKLRYFVDRGCVIVGHGLQKDFETANLFVPPEQIRDTVELWRLPHQRKISLRFLASYLLKKDIQDDIHDSIEDARTALLLYKHYLRILHDPVPEPDPWHSTEEAPENLEFSRTETKKLPKTGKERIQAVLRQLYQYGNKNNWTIGLERLT